MTELGWHPKLKNMALVAWTHIIHHIWLVKNERRFNNFTHNVHIRLRTILAHTKMSFSFSKDSTLDRKITLDTLDNLQIEKGYRNAPIIITVKWHNPSLGWRKLNTEGSVQEKLVMW